MGSVKINTFIASLTENEPRLVKKMCTNPPTSWLHFTAMRECPRIRRPLNALQCYVQSLWIQRPVDCSSMLWDNICTAMRPCGDETKIALKDDQRVASKQTISQMCPDKVYLKSGSRQSARHRGVSVQRPPISELKDDQQVVFTQAVSIGFWWV